MNLLMLTKFYPFGTGEAFIENEIKILAKNFEKIVIIACEVPENSEQVRTLPQNVVALPVFTKGRRQKIFDVLGGIRQMFFGNNVIKAEYRECKGIKQRIFLSYFEEKSRRIFNKIIVNKFLEQLNQEQYVLYSYWLFMTARVGTLIKTLKKPEYAFSRAHGYDLYKERNAINYLPYRTFLLNEYDDIFPCSQNGVEYLTKEYPVYKEKVSIACLGTIDHGIEKYRKKDVFEIVSCSRVVSIKRVPMIVEALKIIEQLGKVVEWTHVGDGEEYDILKKTISTELKTTKVNLLGNMPNEKVLELYKQKQFDLFVNVSTTEGLPVSIMEAISFGIPTVATDVGGTSEIVIEDYNGKLISEDCSAWEVATAIKFFMELTDEEYADFRQKARDYWKKYFQANVNYEELCNIIRQHC